jgi:hypothetical protein
MSSSRRRYSIRRVCHNWCVWDNTLKEIVESFGENRQQAHDAAYEYNIGVANGARPIE